MKRFLLLIIIGFMLLSLAAQETDEELGSRPANNFKPMIMVCNGSDSGMDIKIGNNDTTVFFTRDMAPYAATALTPVDYEGYYYVYTKMPGDADWTIMWDDTFDIEYEISLEPGEILGIIISPEDYVKDVSVDYYPSHKAQVMFANMSDQDQYNLEVGSEFGKHDGVWFDKLGDYSLSDFKRIGDGYHSIFWQTSGQKGSQEFNFLPDADGDQTIKYFDLDKWYLILTYDSTATQHEGLFFEVTPPQPYIK